MSSVRAQADLPEDFHLLIEPGFADPKNENRPNRLCICLSDLHLTDGTVGNQSADAVVWASAFETITDLCVDHEAEELTLVLAGDVVDMIRTDRWSRQGVYPWDRGHPAFKPLLREIMRAIIDRHARSADDGSLGFFQLLKELPEKLRKHEYKGRTSRVGKIRFLALLGNHDKEIFADEETLKMFYEECLGQSVQDLSEEYRRWIGIMYFNDANKYLDLGRKSVPWLPFYWGDLGFRLFITHGQWRDPDNSRSILGKTQHSSWRVQDGWQLKRWQNLNFSPFTEACFGDSVAAGLLSGFIYRTKKRLLEMRVTSAQEQKEITRLLRILDELDLYRPTSAAIKRVIEETWRLRRINHRLSPTREIVETELLNSAYSWLSWDFTMATATPSIGLLLGIAKSLTTILKLLGARIELGFLYAVMGLMSWKQRGRRDAPSFKEMRAFPAFIKSYRQSGFRIHGEGHTHIPLEEELYFKDPEELANRPNYTYINVGTWRDRMVPKEGHGYRRRGVGRALVVLDKAGRSKDEPRDFAFWVQDVLTWGDKADKLD